MKACVHKCSITAHDTECLFDKNGAKYFSASWKDCPFNGKYLDDGRKGEGCMVPGIQFSTSPPQM
jgi:hypothetical protein